jgi:HSP20 family protein
MTGDTRKWMWAEACALIERAEQLQHNFYRPGSLGAHGTGWEPPVDIFESEHEIWVVAALPGVTAGDVEVVIDEGLLVISGLRRLPTAARSTAIRRLEIPHGRLERRIRVASGRLALGRTELENGCLLVVLTKQR